MFVESPEYLQYPLLAVHSNLQVAGVKSLYKKEGRTERLYVRPTTAGLHTVKEIANHVLFDLQAASCEVKESDILGWYSVEVR